MRRVPWPAPVSSISRNSTTGVWPASRWLRRWANSILPRSKRRPSKTGDAMKPRSLIFAGATVLLLAAGGGYYYWNKLHTPELEARYRTASLERGDLTQIASANGTLNPVVLVNVGTQVSGTV